MHGKAWGVLKDKKKTITVRKQLEIIFHNKQEILRSLDNDYTKRNDVAHNYKLTKEAKDISNWLSNLDGVVDDFDR